MGSAQDSCQPEAGDKVKIDSRQKYVAFAEESLREAFDKLEKGTFEDKKLHGLLDGAFDDLKKDPLVGIKIPKKLWPGEYVRKYDIDNLRKYNLPNGWRLIYTLRGTQVEIVAVILEWFASHKEYEKRFGYKVN